MDEAGVEYAIYDGVQPNPTDVNVFEGLEIYHKNKCRAIVAFGGGSAMDCAKAIGTMHVKKNKAVQQLQGTLKVLRKLPTIFAVPTTAGTGSETTIASVITIVATKHKASINDICLMPKYAVLDPELIVNLGDINEIRITSPYKNNNE